MTWKQLCLYDLGATLSALGVIFCQATKYFRKIEKLYKTLQNSTQLWVFCSKLFRTR